MNTLDSTSNDVSSSSTTKASLTVQICEVDKESVECSKINIFGNSDRELGFSCRISAEGKIICLKDGAQPLQIPLCDYQWMPLGKQILAFQPGNNKSDEQLQQQQQHSMHEQQSKPKPFLLRFETNKDLETFTSSIAACTQQNCNNNNNFISSSCTSSSSSSKSSSNFSSSSASVRKRKCNGTTSEFNSRTEESSASQYFQFYGSLFQQQNMMQDYTRTATYQRAIHENYLDFRDKVVLDVGAGSGILSFFAAQSGAKRVYAVEASSMAENCKSLVLANGLSGVIKVVTGKIEEIELPEPVDVIISEPMGYMLVNERMLESYLYARKFLHKDGGGRMFPTQANLHLALFADEQLFLEQLNRAAFWSQETFHGVNLSCLKNAALDEIFRQPVVDSWHIGILVSATSTWSIDFEKDDTEALQRIEIPFEFSVLRTGYVHGIATWFDVNFVGQTRTIWLSTAPTEPLTHWYQVRLLLKSPLFAIVGQVVKGKLLMLANDKQSYDLDLEMEANDNFRQNKLDLKLPHFRYNGQLVAPPPAGHFTETPTELFNQHLSAVQQQLQFNASSNTNDSVNFGNLINVNNAENNITTTKTAAATAPASSYFCHPTAVLANGSKEICNSQAIGGCPQQEQQLENHIKSVVLEGVAEEQQQHPMHFV